MDAETDRDIRDRAVTPLQKDECEIVGGHSDADGRPVPDAQWLRIEWLTAHVLKLLGSDESGWLHLYLDPGDGRYWEESYPFGHTHGGGPPSLRCVSAAEAGERYPNAPLTR